MVTAMATIRGVANSNAWQVHFLHFTWFQSLHLILKRKDSGSSSNKYFSLEQDHPKSLGITFLWIAAMACLIIASKYFNIIYFNIHILHVSNKSIFRTVPFFLGETETTCSGTVASTWRRPTATTTSTASNRARRTLQSAKMMESLESKGSSCQVIFPLFFGWFIFDQIGYLNLLTIFTTMNTPMVRRNW